MTEGPALAAEIERLFALLLRQGGRFSRLEPGELPTIQRLALAAVVDDGPLRIGELADHLGTTDATASRTVDALEEARLLQRCADPDDRRAVRINATPRGRRTLAERRELLAELVGSVVGEMAERDRALLVELLGQLNERLGEIPTESPAASAASR